MCFLGMKSLSVVMPVFNEEATVESSVLAILELRPRLDLELVVVESNSNDQSRAILVELQTKHEFKLILEGEPGGKGLAVRRGLKECDGDVIVIMDADNEYRAKDLLTIHKFMLDSGSRFVLGNRHVAGRRMRDFPGERLKTFYYNFGHHLFTQLFNVLFGTKLSDPATMWKVFYKSDIEGYDFIGKRFEFDWEILALLVRRGIHPREIDIDYRSRNHEEGKKIRSFRDPISWLFYIFYFRFRTIK